MIQEHKSPTLLAPTRPAQPRISRQKDVASAPGSAIWRVVIALAFGVGVTTLAWRHIGTHLSATTDIVGYPTFADFESRTYIYRFYDITLVLPAATILGYLILARFGPLRASSSRRDWPPVLEETEPSPVSLNGRVKAKGLEQIDRINGRDAFWALSRIGLTALTVGLEASVWHSVPALTPTQFGIVAAVLYVIAVGGITILVGLRSRFASASSGGMDDAEERGDWISRPFARVLPVVNALASVVVLPLLVLVSSSTTVTVASDGRVVHYPWLPPWLGALATIVAFGVLVLSFLRTANSAARRLVERRMLLVVVVPILIFMVTASLASAQGHFVGFDDAMSMVGAKLTFWHGLWPWRDVVLLHGFLYDALYGAVGMWVLSPTRWGSNSGQTLFVLPFTFVALYSFMVYFARRNTLLIVAGTLALVLGLIPAWGGTRYVLFPVVLILFDRVLRHGSWTRCLLFMASVVLMSVVTPEATLLMVGVLVTLVLAEAIHRSRDQSFTEGFSRTARCAITGAAWVAVWSIFLTATGTFSGFVAYYQTAVAGHELEGAFPPQWSLTGSSWATIEFVLPIVLFLLTVWKVVAKLIRRSPWRPTEWVLVASSTPVLLFYQVALDRMDLGHVTEVFETLVPFIILWAMEIAHFADSMVVRAWTAKLRQRLPTARLRVTAPVTFVGILAIAAWSPTTPIGWTNAAGAFHVVVPDAAPSQIPLGYTEPGAIDVAQITDLSKVLDRYAGKDGPVFDFTNEMGILYFLLDRVPGARFYVVANGQTSRAQNLEVGDLQQSRPRLVIFNNTTFGLPDWDGILSMERNYILSQYLLDHYRPLLDTHGQLVMLRNDLFKKAPPIPDLSQPPVTTDLYFDVNVPSCDWGDVPNFLIHPSSNAIETGLNLPIQPDGTGDLISVNGWAFDTLDHQPASQVLVVSRGQTVSAFQTGGTRYDVAADLHTAVALQSGFTSQFLLPPGASYRIYVLNADGSVTPLPDSAGGNEGALPPSVTTPNGILHPVRVGAVEGSVDSTSETLMRTFSVTIPVGADLSSYQWMVMQSSKSLGMSHIDVTDSISGGASHVIAFNTLSRTGNEVFTRVGSCIQWHGYDAPSLRVLVSGPATPSSVHLLK